MTAHSTQFRRGAHYIELGTPLDDEDPVLKSELIWEPILKLGAAAGDSWISDHWGPDHPVHYLVEGFGDYEGPQPADRHGECAVAISHWSDVPFRVETLTIYIRGVGNVLSLTRSNDSEGGAMRMTARSSFGSRSSAQAPKAPASTSR